MAVGIDDGQPREAGPSGSQYTVRRAADVGRGRPSTSQRNGGLPPDASSGTSPPSHSINAPSGG